MQALDRYISSLNLGTKLNYQLFFGGLIIKIVGIFIFSSPIIENLFLPFIEYFITSKAEKFISDNEEIKIEVKKASGKKCSRCWKILDEKCDRASCPI